MTTVSQGKRTGFMLRLPPKLHDALTAIAKKERRSLNAEIVVRLERSLEGPGR